jgi:hypothetical protein
MKPRSKWRTTALVDGHEWGFYGALKYECCLYCGMIRRADKKNSPCKGKAEIALR